MNTHQAVELRKNLEFAVLELLQEYRDATGLTPTRVDVETADISSLSTAGDRSIAITGVRIRVEV